MKGKEKYKFAVGDRVVYRRRGVGGNGLRDGDHGKVIARQNFRDQNDYIVEFDRFSPEYMDLKEFKVADGYGWACTEEHLDSRAPYGEVPKVDKVSFFEVGKDLKK